MICTTWDVSLCLTRPGRLLPWLGPALRGLLAGHFKERVCLQPATERVSRWRYCTGCPHMAHCSYGQTFEPDPSPGVEVFRGQEDAARPVVLAPYYPLPVDGQEGLQIPARIVGIGHAANGHIGALLDTLGYVGITCGLSPDGVKFTVQKHQSETAIEQSLSPVDLPAHADTLPGKLPRVGVGLTAPLFLHHRDESGQRLPIERPEFSDLFRAAMRIIGRLFTLYDEPLAVDYAGLAEAAGRVRRIDDCYAPFTQVKWSSRGDQRFQVRGVVGGGVYADVPLSLLPWLVWGGRLHVGGHRVAGAGGWRLVLD